MYDWRNPLHYIIKCDEKYSSQTSHDKIRRTTMLFKNREAPI